MINWLLFLAGMYSIVKITNVISYGIMKDSILKRQKWDLNICCGKTDGGGINADIVKHSELPNFVLINHIENLPFVNKQFNQVLCSHTIEHVDNPAKVYEELRRVGENITIVLPPLWDLTAAFNILEHQWIFFTFKKEHNQLPFHIRLPFAQKFQKAFGQKIHA
jgi:SAM-dependent methyltransferase